MTGPATYIGMREHRDVHGRVQLVGVVDVRLLLEPGTALHLRRDDDGRGFVLQVVRPAKPWTPTKRERSELLVANGPRGALRPEPSDHHEHQLEESDTW